MSKTINPYESLYDVLVFDKKFGWSRETWERLHLLNKIYLTNIDKA